MQTRLFLGFRLHETLKEALTKTPKGLSQLFLMAESISQLFFK